MTTIFSNLFQRSVLIAFMFGFVFFEANHSSAESLLRTYTKEQKANIYSVLPFQPLDTFLSYQALKDLNVPELIQSLDRTQLGVGGVEFARLMQPTTDHAKVQRRVAIFKELLDDNSRLFYRLEKIFNPASYYTLPISNRYDVNFPGDPPPVRVSFVQDDENLFVSLFDANVLPDRSVSNQLILGLVGVGFTALCIGDARRDIIRDRAEMAGGGWLNYANLWRSIFIKALGGATLAYQALGACQELAITMSEVDEFVLKFGKAIAAMEAINDIIHTSTTLSMAFPAFSDFKASSANNPRLAWTLGALARRVSAEKSIGKYWAMKDSIAIYDEIRHLKDDFKNALWWVARVDAYLSVVRWIKERDALGLPTTFAKFNDSPSPQFRFKGLSNPLFEKAVPNDFELNGHAVITGPHSLGKTSSIRLVAYAHIMLQSIGIVPADEADAAFVSVIMTYFNISDGTQISSFVAELTRMTEFLAEIKHRDAKEVMLFLIDEPFAKTPSRVGNRLMSLFLRKVIDIPNVSVILSTHLEEPSKIASLRSDRMINLQPDILESDDIFEPTYKIIPGAADWWFENTDGKTDRYIDWLIAQVPGAKELWLD